MKLIIDIDERVYKDCLKLKSDNDMGVLGFHLINATANGISLEKYEDIIELYSGMSESMQKAVKDVMIVTQEKK